MDILLLQAKQSTFHCFNYTECCFVKKPSENWNRKGVNLSLSRTPLYDDRNGLI